MRQCPCWLAGKPELDILRLMGLFDRPAEQGAIEALVAPPAIQGLTDRLQNLSRADWQYALDDLRAARLLAAPDPDAPGALDCHPLLREHFAEGVRTDNPEAWREAHGRLYEYYAAAAEERPDTIEAMAPLYAAVGHGCQAGRHQEALDEVYLRRILRRNEHFSWRELGAFGADLAALAGFFDPPWRVPVAGLSEADKGFVLHAAGFHLRALGRLAEAAQPMQAALEAAIAQKDWKNAARQADNLSELYLAGGNLVQALDYARQSVELADRSGEWTVQVASRTALADALHQAGRRAEAEATFAEAEAIQKADQPQYPLLYSVQGSQYCDLLLSQGEYEQVQSRVEKFFEWRLPSDSLLSIALEHLSLGRAHLLAAQAGRGEGDYAQAAAHLERALDGLRQAGRQDILPLGLLARAELRLATGALDEAQRDLDEAFAIAGRGGMRLHQADCHLVYARLHLAGGQNELARDSLAQAKAIVGKSGYHRRDEEIEALEEKLRMTSNL